MRPAARGFRGPQPDDADFSTFSLPRMAGWIGVLVPTAIAVLSLALAVTVWLVNASMAYALALAALALVAYGVRLALGPWTVHATPLQTWEEGDGETWFERGWSTARRRMRQVEQAIAER